MIKILKLIDGRELIGDVIDENDFNVRMKEPLLINYFWNPPSIIPISILTRYVQFAEEDVYDFPMTPGMHLVEPLANAARFYELTIMGYKTSMEQEIDQMLSTACFESGTKLAKEQNVLNINRARRMN